MILIHACIYVPWSLIYAYMMHEWFMHLWCGTFRWWTDEPTDGQTGSHTQSISRWRCWRRHTPDMVSFAMETVTHMARNTGKAKEKYCETHGKKYLLKTKRNTVKFWGFLYGWYCHYYSQVVREVPLLGRKIRRLKLGFLLSSGNHIHMIHIVMGVAFASWPQRWWNCSGPKYRIPKQPGQRRGSHKVKMANVHLGIVSRT